MAKNYTTLSTILLLLILLSCSPSTKSNLDESGTAVTSAPVVMAYYVPEQNYDPTALPVEMLSHIIFSFTNVIDGEMKFRKPEEAGPKLEALVRSEEHTSELQSRENLVCRLLLEKK